jgi:hypothetical protein
LRSCSNRILSTIVIAGEDDRRGGIVREPDAAESRRFCIHAGVGIQDYPGESADCRGAGREGVSVVARNTGRSGAKIDLVDVFRRPEYVDEIVEQAIQLKIPAIWLQEGVINERAAEKARKAGIFVVMDRCVLKEHRARFG